MKNDTIVAIATPPGEGGIGVVRLSGPEAITIGSRLFRGRLRPRRAAFGYVADPQTGEVVDEALAILMPAPRTYTREDILELQTHAGPVCLRRVVELCLAEGARLAEPGEFTLRAFLNGRLDLAQAEAVLDVVQARTDASLRLAVQGLGGRLSARVSAARRALLDILAYLSARADFPDEDVPAADVSPDVCRTLDELQALLRTADYGMVYRQGTRVAIVGAPNVGKSSLLNRLLREERAIVTAIPGTTRDTLEETLNIGGVPIILTDTAGLTESEDPVERIGVERSRVALDSSDALLVVLDSSRPLLGEEHLLLRETAERPRVIAMNKIDLCRGEVHISNHPTAVAISALTGEGIAELERRLAGLVTGGQVLPADGAVVTNPRHKAALARAVEHLCQVRRGLEAGVAEDMVSADVRSATEALGEITGESVTEDLLDTIFHNFCIGK